MISPEYATARRTDLSSFLVHLTRDDQHSAKQNLIKILKSKTINALNHHCLFQKSLNTRPKNAAKFRVVCFTEAPLAELNYLTQQMYKRSKQLSPYGLVFRKRTVYEFGGNPVFYLATGSTA